MSAPRQKLLIFLLRACGLIDLLALLVAFIPSSWIISMHGHLAMGPFPEETIAFYLARSSSLMYAVHGVLLIFVSFDVERYLPLIRLLAGLALVHGVILMIIDYRTGMPWWWTCGEGFLLISWGILVLLLTRQQSTIVRA